MALVLRVRIAHKPGMLGQVTAAIGDCGATIESIDLIDFEGGDAIREIVVEAPAEEWDEVAEAVGAVDGATVLESVDQALSAHRGGVIEQRNRHPLRTVSDLSTFYTPGVARVSEAIAEDASRADDYTFRGRTVAVLSNGTAVLGLGDVGPAAALPVMEGKAMLFKDLAGVDAFPLCVDAHDADALVAAGRAVAPSFAAINLEDVAAPDCFKVERALAEALDIPVFHDDQHGTAVVVLAALLNTLELTGRRLEDLRILVAGVGAAGMAITRTLLDAGVREIVGTDAQGVVETGREDYESGDMDAAKRWYAENTNPEGRSGEAGDAIEGMDVFIGVSVPGAVDVEDLRKMADEPIVFALGNPTPEVPPEEAGKIARIVATGRSDYPNQINNVLCFPGLFRGLLDAGARRVAEPVKRAAADAIARAVDRDDLRDDYILPSVLDREVPRAVARAVCETARRDEGPLAAIELDP